MEKLALLVVSCLVWIPSRAEADPLSLAPGETRIVVPGGEAGPEIAQAAGLLQKWLRKAARVERGFAVATGEPGEGPAIALGRQAWIARGDLERLGAHGFLIRRRGNTVAICGASDQGTFFGAVGFLDKFCAVRFYMPGDLFTSLPERRELLVDEVETVEIPYVKSCFLSGVGGGPGEREWIARNAVNRRLGGTHQHSMFLAFAPERFAARWPEIYPLMDGKRYIPQNAADQRWQPCFSEPKLIEAALESADDYFARMPEAQYMAFSIQDSHVMCQCARCQEAYARGVGADPKLKAVDGFGRVYWQFMNRLAERLEAKRPGKSIVGLAYANTRLPPPFELHKNIIVFTNFHLAELEADDYLKAPPGGMSRLDAWLAVAAKYGNHDWYQGHGFLMPRMYTGYWSIFMKALKARGAGAFQHAEGYPNWGLDGPKYYVLGRLWWDPDCDLERLWRRMCGDLFGRAAEPMYGYFMTLEELWTTLDNRKGPERKIKRFGNQFLNDAEDQALIRRCRALLDEAARQASTGAEKQRIELFSKTFRLSEQLFALAAAAAPSAAAVEAAKRYAGEMIVPDPMTLFGAMRSEQALAEAIDQIVAGKRAAR